MKVELLVNLKYGTFKYHGKGEVFESPFPTEIQHEVNLKRNTVRIIEDPTPAQVSTPVIEPEPEIVKEVETPKKPIAKIVRVKKG